MNDSAAMKASAILNTASELVIAILPVLAVFRLQVDPRQRWTVIGLLSLGFLVTLAGCLRTYTIWRTVESYDLAWWSTPHWICSEVEIDLALVCAIIPALPLAHACSFFLANKARSCFCRFAHVRLLYALYLGAPFIE
jgi:hypothetical protein